MMRRAFVVRNLSASPLISLLAICLGFTSACSPILLDPNKYVGQIDLSSVAPSGLSYAGSPLTTNPGDAISQAPTLAAGTLPVTYSAPSLPSGLTINPTTGVISGSVAAPLVGTYTVTVTNSASSTTFGFNLTVRTPPSGLSYAGSPLTTNPGDAISQAPTLAAGTSPVTYSAPSLPSGLTINPTTGVISGSVAAPLVGTYTVTATNPASSTTFDFDLTVRTPPSGLSYAGSPLVIAAGTPVNEAPTLAAGTLPVTYSAPSLPSGLTIHPTTGVISGAPLAPLGATNYTVTVTNPASSTTFDFNLTVTLGVPYGHAYANFNATQETTITPQNPIPGACCSITSYSSVNLPLGLSLNSSTGQITGRPMGMSGSYTFQITATNIAGSTPTSLTMTLADDGGGFTKPNDLTQLIRWYRAEDYSALGNSTPVPFVSTTGNTTLGSALITGVANTTSVSVGQSISGTGIPGGTTVSAVTVNTITLSANATATGVGVALNISTLNTWIDQAGGFNSGQSGSTPGTYFTSTAGGFPSVAITGAQRLRSCSSAAGYPGQTGAWTYIYVVSRATPITSRMALHGLTNATNNRGNYLGFTNDTTLKLSPNGYVGTPAVSGTIPAATGALEYFTGAHDITSATDRPGLTLWRNHTELATDAAATAAGAAAPTFSAMGTLSGTNTSVVHLLEVIMFSKALPQAERCEIHRYLANKYGLTAVTCP